MRLQDQLVRMTQKALADTIRAAEHVPAEMLDWAPADSARSTLSQMQEVALTPRWIRPLMEGEALPEMGRHQIVAMEQAKRALGNLAECIAVAREETAIHCGLIESFPDDQLEEEVVLPFGGGIRMTMADVLGLHAWNLTYHLGQINYIQSCLGDREMH